MDYHKKWWIDFLKKILLVLATIFLFLPIIQLFTSLNELGNEKIYFYS